MGGVFDFIGSVFSPPKFPEPPPDTSEQDAASENRRRLKAAAQSREFFSRSANALGPIQLQAPGVKRSQR